MTRFHVTVKLINVPFNKDRILIKDLHLLKGYTAQKLSKKNPSKHFN